MQQSIGFIGLGHMGMPIATNLLRAGFAVRAYDINPQKSIALENLGLGAVAVSSVQEAVVPGGVTITMVTNNEELRAVSLGNQGILSVLAGGIHLSLSTVSPRLAQHIALSYDNQQAGTYLSGTVLGRPEIAAAGNLTVYLAGAERAKKRVLPLLQVIGSSVEDLGENLALANVTKLGANLLIEVAMDAMGEFVALIEGYGGDPAYLLPLVAKSVLFQGSAVYSGYSKMIGAKDFTDAQFPVGTGLKDAGLILEAGQEVDVTLPRAQLSYHGLSAALADGRGEQDWSSLSLYSSPPSMAATK